MRLGWGACLGALSRKSGVLGGGLSVEESEWESRKGGQPGVAQIRDTVAVEYTTNEDDEEDDMNENR